MPYWLTVDEERDLCMTYIRETRTLTGDSSPVTDTDVDDLYAKVIAYKMVSLVTPAVPTIYIDDDQDQEWRAGQLKYFI